MTWMNVREVAVYISMSPGAVYQRVHARTIPFHKVGRLLRFKRAEIDHWLMTGPAGYNDWTPLPADDDR